MAILYSTYSLLRHWHYSSSGYDLGIFDQAMWHYSRFEIPRNTIADYPHILAEHFHPILLILVPFYRVLPAPLAPILAMAAADGLRRVLDRIHPEILKKRVAVVAVTFILLMCAILPGKLPVWRLLSPKYYHFSDVEKTGPRALSLIPESASVVAQDGIVPHLSRRDFIYTLRPGAPEADFVVASQRLKPWPNQNWEEIETLLAERKAAGYRTIFGENGWIVLQRSK